MKIEQDKIYHFLGITAVTFLTIFILSLFTTSLSTMYITSVVTSGIVSVGKELHDSRPGGTGFSSADLLADVAGFVAGSSLGLILIAF